jgi:cytochrome b6-f complex iron-sulfur subunit
MTELSFLLNALRRKPMDRRAFLLRVGVGALASSLPMAIAACTPETSETATQKSTGSGVPVASGFTAVGTMQDLDKNGFIQDKKFAAGPLLVVRDPVDKTKLVAVNATCTHKGCVVDWNAKDRNFLCPCHGAKYKLDGTVANGPADKPLATFKVKTEGSSILVSSS